MWADEHELKVPSKRRLENLGEHTALALDMESADGCMTFTSEYRL